ncbi:ATP-binding protein [Paraburkholderia sediminicola]|uniref:ATP-binding protein n=1 Tax=Paraburkholderia sediminicola TaxID=458836 RepID=UPI0038BAFE65
MMFSYWVRSLSVRLWVSSVVALAVSLTVIATFVVYTFTHYPSHRFAKHSNLASARRIADGLIYDNAARPVAVNFDPQTAWIFRTVASDLMYRVLDASGRTVLASRNAYDGAAWLQDSPGNAVDDVKEVKIGNRSFGVATLRIRHGSDAYFVQIARSAELNAAIISEKFDPLPELVAFTTLIATVVFGLTLPFAVRRILRPLRETSAAASQVTPCNLKARLSTERVPSEITPLIEAFNEALTRLENGFNVQQQFLAAAAHELQTPLTLMRGQIELQPEIERKDLLFREIDLMARQVRQLLHLAEVSESQNFSFGSVDRREVVEDVLAYLARKAEKDQVRTVVRISDPLPLIRADRSALFILLKNVVENAINVTPAMGVVTVALDEMSVSVCDEGPGLNLDYVPRLFDRFWRAPDARHDGAGLGLAICKEIATAHNWTITAENWTAGARFTLRF